MRRQEGLSEASVEDLTKEKEVFSQEETSADKEWFFHESIRIRSEKQELEALYQKVMKEKDEFHREMEHFDQKVAVEKNRLKQDQVFFEKKMDILKAGFAQLEADRRRFEREKKDWESGRMEMGEERDLSGAIHLFFAGVDNPLTLKKRYRDLIKIYHPDNVCGDTDVIRLINDEYEMLQEEFTWQRKA